MNRRLAFFIALGLIWLLPACSIPVGVNLLEAFPGAASGGIALPVPDGTLNLLPRLSKPSDSITLPLSTPVPVRGLSFPEIAVGVPLDLGEEEVPTLMVARLSYAVEVASEGPLSGTVKVQPYLAPSGTQAASSAYALGDVKTVALGPTAQTLAASILLNEAQLNAISEKSLQLALGVLGERVNLEPGPQAGVSYAFKELTLEVERVRSEVTEYFPDADGDALDFSDQEVPGPGRVKTLGIDYRVVISTDAELGGNLQAQVYIAPPLEPGQSDADAPLFSDAYLFGKEQSLNLDQSQIVLEDSAALKGVQQEVIRSKKLRIGVLVKGEVDVSLGEPAELSYRFSKLELAGGYSLF